MLLAFSKMLILKIWIAGLMAIAFCTLVISLNLSKLDQFSTFLCSSLTP